MEGCGRGGGIRADGSWWYSGIDGGGGGGGEAVADSAECHAEQY